MKKKDFAGHSPLCCCAMCMSEHDGSSPHSHTAGDGGDGGILFGVILPLSLFAVATFLAFGRRKT